ncbi:hypothetical protein ACWEL8_09620 [Streptomyces sp. NPDC004690]
MAPATHFAFGVHPDHGFVAAATTLPSHLAQWFLERVQFEPVPDTPGLYRLTNPDQDGARRTRQAVRDLRRQNYTVLADYSLDPGRGPSHQRRPSGFPERRSRLAQAAASRTTQRSAPPTTSPPPIRTVPTQPTYAPTVHLRSSTGGRVR